MKKLTLILVLLSTLSYCLGQDIINTKNNKRLNVKIIEQTDKVIKYRMNDYIDGPVISLNTRYISSIEYRNGNISLAGNQNPRKNKPIGISAGVAKGINDEFGFLLVTGDYFIIPQIDLELNGGTDFAGAYYFTSGAKFHINSNLSESRLTPLSGLLFGSFEEEMLIQVPIGLNYITKFGLNSSLSFNYMIQSNQYQTSFIELNLGWRFK